MKVQVGSTAILVFTRTDEQEASAKSFVPKAGKAMNKSVARLLIRHTIDTVKATRLPIFISRGSAQVGECFGERFANAIESVFEAGYQKVIAVGNDCPSISPELLQNVSNQLQGQGVVLGPDVDGGVYLVGISADAYHRSSFIELPWESAYVQSGFKDYAQGHNLTTQWITQQSDIDNASDLIAALNKLTKAHPLRKRIEGLIASLQNTTPQYSSPFLFKRHLAVQAMRGPPVTATCS